MVKGSHEVFRLLSSSKSTALDLGQDNVEGKLVAQFRANGQVEALPGCYITFREVDGELGLAARIDGSLSERRITEDNTGTGAVFSRWTTVYEDIAYGCRPSSAILHLNMQYYRCAQSFSPRVRQDQLLDGSRLLLHLGCNGRG